MAKQKLKLQGAALAFFQRVGSKGGRMRAQNNSRKQLKRWARLGGRPGRSLKERVAALRKKFERSHGSRQRKFESLQEKFFVMQSALLRDFEAQIAAFQKKFAERQLMFAESHGERQKKFEMTHIQSASDQPAFEKAQASRQEAFELLHMARQKKFEKAQAGRQKRFETAHAFRQKKFETRERNFKITQAEWQSVFDARVDALQKTMQKKQAA